MGWLFFKTRISLDKIIRLKNISNVTSDEVTILFESIFGVSKSHLTFRFDAIFVQITHQPDTNLNRYFIFELRQCVFKIVVEQ